MPSDDGFDANGTLELCGHFPRQCSADLRALVKKEGSPCTEAECVRMGHPVLNPEEAEKLRAGVSGIDRTPSMDCAFVLTSGNVVLSEFKFRIAKLRQIKGLNLPEKLRQTNCTMEHLGKTMHKKAYFVFKEDIKERARDRVSRLFLAEKNVDRLPKNMVVSLRDLYAEFF